MTVSVFAPAKINLTLHVTGQRPDGYHSLDSLVVFAEVGDQITVADADELSLSVTGRFKDTVPTDATNLVMQAANLIGDGRGARIQLEKTLPPSSGIGGGSSDAAATLLALGKLWGCDLPKRAAIAELGADIPVCLEQCAMRMRGMGEALDPVAEVPELHFVLVNNGWAISTQSIFAQRVGAWGAPMAEHLPQWQDFNDFIRWLFETRNDLERPAASISPDIKDVLWHVSTAQGCAFSRMSGSGGTCFGIFETAGLAQVAAKSIQDKNPNWWVVAAKNWTAAS